MSNGTVQRIPFGVKGDLPAVGRYENHLLDNLAVYRPSTATFHMRMSNGTVQEIQYGMPGDLPAVGYYEGLQYTNVGVYRPSNSTFYFRRANLSTATVPFGAANFGDVPALGRFE
jgi:hypothetical protein